MYPSHARGFRLRLILIASIATALILGLAAIMAVNVLNYRRFNALTRRSQQVQQQILGTSNAVHATRASLGEYLLSGDPGALQVVLARMTGIDDSSRQLVAMTATQPEQNRRARSLRKLLLAHVAVMRDALRIYQQSGQSAALDELRARDASAGTATMQALVGEMRHAERAHLARTEAQRGHAADLATWSAIACLSCALLLVLSAMALIFREQRITLRSREALMQAYLQLAQSLEDSRGLTDRMQRLHMLSETLQSCRNMHEALEVLPPSLDDMLPGISGRILLVNASRNLVENAAGWGDLILNCESVFAPDDCLALRRGQAYPEPDMPVKIRCAHLGAGKDDGNVTWACIPLLAQGETLGVMHLQLDGPMRPEIHELAMSLGEQLGLMLGNLKLQESLRMQSIHDPLTGLFNRRYLEASLARELLRNTRHDRRLTLLMMDIDQFKRFNDMHGHDAGDELLQQFASMLRDRVRVEDISCRYGGEEFTVILPETDLEAGLARAEDIRAHTSQLKVRHRGQLLGPVSVSIGLAVQPLHGSDPETLVHAADQALYRAKQGGRNRVEVASREAAAIPAMRTIDQTSPHS